MPTRPQRHRPHPTPREHRDRPTACQRGYDRRWRKLREAHAAAHPAICAEPGCGYAGPSAEMHLDHIVARAAGGTDHPSNLQWLCHKHHSTKTVRENGGLCRS